MHGCVCVQGIQDYTFLLRYNCHSQPVRELPYDLMNETLFLILMSCDIIFAKSQNYLDNATLDLGDAVA